MDHSLVCTQCILLHSEDNAVRGMGAPGSHDIGEGHLQSLLQWY